MSAPQSGEQKAWAIRNPRNTRGLAHRIETASGFDYVACGTTVGRFTQAERLPVEHTAPEDRCLRCWAGTPFARPTAPKENDQ